MLQQQQELQENQLAGAKNDHSLVLEQEECADCQQSNNEASNLLLHPNSIAVADRGKASKDALDESLCGDPLMYATFVAPVHQYSTETEPSRQVRKRKWLKEGNKNRENARKNNSLM